jgi:hypothetical protein
MIDNDFTFLFKLLIGMLFVCFYKWGYYRGHVDGIDWMKKSTWTQFGWKDE